MSELYLNEHISQQFNAELEKIRNRVLAMGGLVEEQTQQAILALVKGDGELAEQVIADDRKVNTMEVTIDEECSRILARRQPAATDLRLVVAVIKTITDMERIGDEAKKIAKFADQLADQDRPSNGYSEVKNLGAQVCAMVNAALDAFARLDPQAAKDVVLRDEDVDKEYEAITRQCITFMMEDPRTIRRVLGLMWVIRALERIGDHAKNMAEYVIYLVEGKDVRHISVEDLEQELATE